MLKNLFGFILKCSRSCGGGVKTRKLKCIKGKN